jgi:hypothetical protein
MTCTIGRMLRLSVTSLTYRINTWLFTCMLCRAVRCSKPMTHKEFLEMLA